MKLFESPELWAVTGPAIRPGGLDLTERAGRFCGLPVGSEVLDVGCGLGATMNYLRGRFAWRTVGIDASEVMIREGVRRWPKARFVLGAAERLPFGNMAMKAVFCECVFSLTPDRIGTLREFFRVLAPDGFLVLSDLYARNPGSLNSAKTVPGLTCLDRAVGRDALEDMVMSAGFDIQLWEDHSDRLKRLAADLVFAHGSLAEFWPSFFSCSGDACNFQDYIRQIKPGYFLLIAQKEAGA